MAELVIQVEKIRNNIKYLSAYFDEHDIHWSLITKVFSGDTEFLKNVLTDDVIEKIDSVGDSRLTSLKNLKAVNPNISSEAQKLLNYIYSIRGNFTLSGQHNYPGTISS